MLRLKYLLLPIAGALSAILSFIFAAPYVKTLDRPWLKPDDPATHFTYGTTWTYVQHATFGLFLCGLFCLILETGRRSPRQVLKATILGMIFGAVFNSIADSGADYIGIQLARSSGTTGELLGGLAWFVFVPASLAFTIAFAIGPTKQRMARAFFATIVAAVLTFATRCITSVFAAFAMGLNAATQGTPGSRLEASVPIFLADAIAVGVVLGLTMLMSDRVSRAGSIRLIYGRNEYRDWSLDHTANRIGSSEVEIPIRGFQGVETVHACIFRQGNQFVLDSQHFPGFVNGYPVSQAMLNHGDVIQLGEARLVFYARGAVRSTGQEWTQQSRMQPHPGMVPQSGPFPGKSQPGMPMPGPMGQPIHGQFPQPAPGQMPNPVGAPLMQPVPAPMPVAQHPSAPRFFLVDLAGKELPLQMGTNSVGREVGNTVCFPANGTVSRAHASISIEPTGAFVSDSGSANGTRVNGTPTAGPTPLKDGDTVSFGSANLTFRVQA